MRDVYVVIVLLLFELVPCWAQPVPACGQPLASFGGQTAFSNGPQDQGTGTSCAGGSQYQCVEFVKRFYSSLGVNTSNWRGNANTYVATAASKGLVVVPNSVPPAPNDILVFDGDTYGHVAIVTSVSQTSVNIIEQNWSPTGTATVSMQVNNGVYTVGPRGHYTVLGWLRATPSQITIGAPGDSGGNVVPFGTVGSMYQQVYAQSLFGTTPITITGISFSRTNVSSSGANSITSAEYTFSFSTTSKSVDGLDDSNLQNNIGPDNQTFFSGSLSGNPGVVLTIPGASFTYNPLSGNLLLTITQSGGTCCGGIFFDARNGTAVGTFSRASTSGFNGTSGFGLVTTFTTSK